MKRIVILSLLLCMLTGCAQNPSDGNGQEAPIGMPATYESGIYHDKNWDDHTGSYENNVIPDMETAITVASAIFDAMEKSSAAEKFTPQDVFYDEVDGIWIVSFWESIPEDTQDSAPVVVGDCCSIAIREADGTVLRIWFGE
jgi:hypothetical protein